MTPKFYKYQWQIKDKVCNTCQAKKDKELSDKLLPVIEVEEPKLRTCLFNGPNCEGEFLTVKAVRTCPTCANTELYRDGSRLAQM